MKEYFCLDSHARSHLSRTSTPTTSPMRSNHSTATASCCQTGAEWWWRHKTSRVDWPAANDCQDCWSWYSLDLFRLQARSQPFGWGGGGPTWKKWGPKIKFPKIEKRGRKGGFFHYWGRFLLKKYFCCWKTQEKFDFFGLFFAIFEWFLVRKEGFHASNEE